MWRDFRIGFRQWRRNKVFAAVVILLLGVGIGANTLIFSFVNAMLLKPLPVRDPQNLFLVTKNRIGQEAQGTLWKERILAWLAGFFGIVSLLLAAAGIYGALAYSVASRTREIGIRVAVDAQQRDILRTVCGRMSIAVGFGLLFGIVAAALLLKLAQSLFFGVQALDPYAFSTAVMGLLFCGAVAAAIPALRAIRTDPAQALRTE